MKTFEVWCDECGLIGTFGWIDVAERFADRHSAERGEGHDADVVEPG